MLPLFLLFSRKMEDNIKEKVQTKGMIAIHQGDSTVTDPSKDARIHKRLGTGKTLSYAAKTRENPH